MTCFCMWLTGFAMGLFAAFFIYGWLDEREDRYAGITVKEEQLTSIEWSLRKQSIPDKYAVLPRKKRAGGHLGYLDHKSKQRYATWIEGVKVCYISTSKTA